MSFKISFANDVTNAEENVRGSGGRLNVSSRQDSRGYYNSRDEGLAFATAFTMASVATDEFFAYWRNASPTLTLVISALRINPSEPSSAKVHIVTGTATGGTEVVPANMNAESSKAAPDDSVVMAMQGNASTPITGITTAGVIDNIALEADAKTYYLSFDDRVRLGQNDGIAVEAELMATTGLISAMIWGYYE